MSIYRQVCPSCNRDLELPSDAMGRMAKCPACDATFQIGQTTQPTPEPVLAPVTASVETPNSTANPYQSASSVAEPLLKAGPLDIAQKTIEEITAPVLPIFAERWVPLILSPLIVAAVSVFVIGVPTVVLIAIAGTVHEAAILVVFPLIILFSVLFSCYSTVGLTRVALATARDEISPLSQLLPPFSIVMRFTGGVLLLTMAMGAVTMVSLLIVVGIANTAGGETIATLLGILGFIVAMVAMFAMQWLLWPWVFVVSDNKGTALGAFGQSYKISDANRMTSFMLLVASIVLSMIGAALCSIGQLVTTPITVLMYAVAYLMLTNQPVADPRVGKS